MALRVKVLRVEPVSSFHMPKLLAKQDHVVTASVAAAEPSQPEREPLHLVFDLQEGDTSDEEDEALDATSIRKLKAIFEPRTHVQAAVSPVCPSPRALTRSSL